MRDRDGKSRQVWARASTEAKAVNALKAKLANRGADSGSAITGETTIKVAAMAWLAELRVSSRAQGTIERHEHVIPLFGDFVPREASLGAITRFLRAVPANRKMASRASVTS